MLLVLSILLSSNNITHKDKLHLPMRNKILINNQMLSTKHIQVKWPQGILHRDKLLLLRIHSQAIK